MLLVTNQLFVTYAYAHQTDSAGDVRPMMQLYSNSCPACLENALLLKIPVLQSHNVCSSAMRICRMSGCTAASANLVKHGHIQADMTVHVQKSWTNLKNVVTENSVLVKKRACQGKACFYKNRDFQSALCHPKKGRCHILHNADLGNL